MKAHKGLNKSTRLLLRVDAIITCHPKMIPQIPTFHPIPIISIHPVCHQTRHTPYQRQMSEIDTNPMPMFHTIHVSTATRALSTLKLGKYQHWNLHSVATSAVCRSCPQTTTCNSIARIKQEGQLHQCLVMLELTLIISLREWPKLL